MDSFTVHFYTSTIYPSSLYLLTLLLPNLVLILLLGPYLENLLFPFFFFLSLLELASVLLSFRGMWQPNCRQYRRQYHRWYLELKARNCKNQNIIFKYQVWRQPDRSQSRWSENNSQHQQNHWWSKWRFPWLKHWKQIFRTKSTHERRKGFLPTKVNVGIASH